MIAEDCQKNIKPTLLISSFNANIIVKCHELKIQALFTISKSFNVFLRCCICYAINKILLFSFITFHQLLIWRANCTKIMMNYHAQCVADDIKFIYAICSIISWIMLLKSRESHPMKKKLWKMFLSSSCLVLAIKLYDKAANLKINILPLITFVSCFNHKFLLLIPLDSPRLLMRFSSATLIMEASDFRCSINKKEHSRLSTSSNSKWNLIQNRHKNNF